MFVTEQNKKQHTIDWRLEQTLLNQTQLRRVGFICLQTKIVDGQIVDDTQYTTRIQCSGV
jgi:hypothetical protein